MLVMLATSLAHFMVLQAAFDLLLRSPSKVTCLRAVTRVCTHLALLRVFKARARACCRHQA